jgi:predicted DCC family thiol-disulfide oxidoreductase YuxK
MPDVVLYDGHCRICTGGARRLAALARPGAVEIRDFQDPGVLAALPQLTHEQCMQAMQLVTPDGRVFSGAEAVVRALASRSLVGIPARLYYLPGLRQLANAAYAWVARNRYGLSGAPACDDAGCALHRPPAAVQSAHSMRAHRILLFAFAAFLAAGIAVWIWKPVTSRTAEDRLRDDADLAALNKIRSAFLKGNWKDGFTLLEPYKDRQFSPESPQVYGLAGEVHRIMDRVNRAMQKAQRSGDMFSAGQHEPAAKLMAEAAREYPENAQLKFTADYYEGIVAFDHKDYDLYLRLAEDNVRKNPGGPATALWLANARATKYAVSGDPKDKALAEEALGTAEELARSAVGANNDEVKTTFDRIRFRIDTRKIVDPQEYDRQVARPQPGQVR